MTLREPFALTEITRPSLLQTSDGRLRDRSVGAHRAAGQAESFLPNCAQAMFNRWQNAVLAEGVATNGTVVDATHVDWTIANRGFQETFELRPRIRVAVPDGTSTEFVSNVPLHKVQRLAGNRTIDCWPRLAEVTGRGARVPVRYDESDRSRILLDLPALVAAILAETERPAGAAEPDA